MKVYINIVLAVSFLASTLVVKSSAPAGKFDYNISMTLKFDPCGRLNATGLPSELLEIVVKYAQNCDNENFIDNVNAKILISGLLITSNKFLVNLQKAGPFQCDKLNYNTYISVIDLTNGKEIDKKFIKFDSPSDLKQVSANRFAVIFHDFHFKSNIFFCNIDDNGIITIAGQCNLSNCEQPIALGLNKLFYNYRTHYVKAWDLSENGKMKEDKFEYDISYGTSIKSISLSPDEKYLAIGTLFKFDIISMDSNARLSSTTIYKNADKIIWTKDLKYLAIFSDSNFSAFSGSQISICDIQNINQPKIVSNNIAKGLNDFCDSFTLKDYALFVIDNNNLNKSINIIDIETGNLIKTIIDTAKSATLVQITMSDDGKYLVTRSIEKNEDIIKIWFNDTQINI